MVSPGMSPLSNGPVQARKTAPRIDGVNSDSVRCESVKVASRTRFLRENNDWVSTDESSDKDATSAGLNTAPVESTGSCGGLANGSTTTSSLTGDLVPSSRSSCALSAGTHSRNDSR